jgi:alpha-L-fucosidase
MKYAVLTAKHHDGFCLFDSKFTDYKITRTAFGRDLVREFADAFRAEGLRVGFYYSLMDWHHPDSAKCAYDREARSRFLDYLEALNTELFTNYGPVDVLWYDMPCPMDSEQAWEANIRNQKLRAICPGVIINERSGGDEDFGTPEEKLAASSRDWESCLTFNRVSWGYTFSDQLKPYTYNVNNLIDTLSYCARNRGNLLLNIGPAPDGSVPTENLPVLQQLGAWLKDNGEAVYGNMRHGETLGGSCAFGAYGGTQLSRISAKGNTVYIWQLIWPRDGLLSFYGFLTPPKRIRLLRTGEEIPFTFKDMRILITGLPKETPDPIANVPVFALDYDELPEYRHCGATYQLDQF